MPLTCASPQLVAGTLTRIALRLLDVTFEPASVCCGERFDHVLESISEAVSDSATAVLAGTPQPAFLAPDLPRVPSAVTRRAQSSLREAVEKGHLPGSTRSVRVCGSSVQHLADDLRAVVEQDPATFGASIGACVTALERLVQIVETYAQGRARVAMALSMPGCSRIAAADTATRNERALLRCLDRTGDDRPLR